MKPEGGFGGFCVGVGIDLFKCDVMQYLLLVYTLLTAPYRQKNWAPTCSPWACCTAPALPACLFAGSVLVTSYVAASWDVTTASS